MGKMERDSVYRAMEKQLAAWPHIHGDDYAAHRMMLLQCARSIDAMTVRNSTPPMQTVTAIKALFGLLKQLAPPAREEYGAPYDVALPMFDDDE